MTDRTILRAGALEVQLLPRAGGSVARFDRIADGTRQSLFRGTNVDAAHALDAGCFPLVPFCNRIRGGTFECDDRTIVLTPNMPPEPSPLHGQGWSASWDVVSVEHERADLSFSHSAGEWPWSYEARQVFSLDSDGLSVALSCRNLSERPMPCGLGLHPYYPCDAETRLDTRVDCAWTIDAQVLPVDRVAATGRYDLRRRLVCGQDLDNGFGGWRGTALIEWPEEPASLRLTSPDAGYFQVFSPASGGFFVAEPVQHANAALNAAQQEWPGLGIVMLNAGEQRSISARFEVIVSG